MNMKIFIHIYMDYHNESELVKEINPFYNDKLFKFPFVHALDHVYLDDSSHPCSWSQDGKQSSQ